MLDVVVVGTGYVGLVTGTCFAELGNQVICVDKDVPKISSLREGRVPFFEPGLEELVVRNMRSNRLRFTSSLEEALEDADVAFIAVGTPTAANGTADLSFVREAAREIALYNNGPLIVVNKSTVPVETADLVASIIAEKNTSGHPVAVVSNPEFLREGSAVSDFMRPDRIVIGSNDPNATDILSRLYAPLEAPIIVTEVRTAEMIKYTANAFLATKISFINEIANLCEQVGADIKDVVVGAGSDKRIGTTFMQPGLGFGGSCFPKDVLALSRIADARGAGHRMLDAVLDVNSEQIKVIHGRLEHYLGGLSGKHIGVLGLAFKPNTDDVRESPAIALIRSLLKGGAVVQAHDPVAAKTASESLGSEITYARSAYEAANDAEALVLATDWNEYKQLDFRMLRKLMVGDLIFDARNLYSEDVVSAAGLVYKGVGRASGRLGRLQALPV